MSQLLRIAAAIGAGILIVMVAALLALGCSSSGPWVNTNAQRWPVSEQVLLEPGIHVTLPGGVLDGDPDAERLLEAARAHLAAFRSDWPGARPVAPLELGITNDRQIPCGRDRRERYDGCWCWETYADGRTRSTILVVRGARDELPALYHELVHHALLGDGDHRDERWPAIDRRGEELAEQLARAR